MLKNRLSYQWGLGLEHHLHLGRRQKQHQDLRQRRVTQEHTMQSTELIPEDPHQLVLEVCSYTRTYSNSQRNIKKLTPSPQSSLSDGPITADVSYDAFLNPSCDGPGDAHTYEVMVWLAQLGGLNPIGTSTATAQIGSSSWNLWKGTNTQTGTTVFSFVAPSTMNTFNGDLMDFFNYLVQNQGVDAGLMVTTVQAGTEVSVGSGLKFTTSSYSISSS